MIQVVSMTSIEMCCAIEAITQFGTSDTDAPSHPGPAMIWSMSVPTMYYSQVSHIRIYFRRECYGGSSM